MPLPSMLQVVESLGRSPGSSDPPPIEEGTVTLVSGDLLQVEADSGGVYLATQAGDEPLSVNDRVSLSKNRLGQAPELLVHGTL